MKRKADPSTGRSPPDPSTGRCAARTSRGPCKKHPIRGAAVCRWHGGAAPQVKAAAARRVAAHEALAALARRGVTPVGNPLAALAELAGEILAVKDVFRERAAQLGEETWRYEDAKGAEQLRAELALYERALDRSARVLEAIARLKIDERLAAVTEQQGQTLAAVVVAVLERLDLGEQAARVRELVAAELERLAA
jgi:hypothetical protein